MPLAPRTTIPAAGIIANVILGVSSIYWRLLASVAPTTLLGYRIFVSLATLAIVIALLGKFKGFVSSLSLKIVGIHALAACLVVINWGTFIWASIHGHVVESGLGYLIAPFVAIVVGAIFMREHMSRAQLAALAVITAAIASLLLLSGELDHRIYIIISVTWGGYVCLKKLSPLDSFRGLFVETMVLASIWILLLIFTPMTLFLAAPSVRTVALILCCGVVSAVPLWLFAFAAARLPLSVMGYFQFVLPTTQLVVAIFYYRQPMSLNTLCCFAVIWASLLGILSARFWRKPTDATLFGVRS